MRGNKSVGVPISLLMAQLNSFNKEERDVGIAVVPRYY